MVEIIAPDTLVEPSEGSSLESQLSDEKLNEGASSAEAVGTLASNASSASSNLVLIGGALASILIGTALVSIVFFSGTNEPLVEEARSDLTAPRILLDSDAMVPAAKNEIVVEIEDEIVADQVLEKVAIEEPSNEIESVPVREEMSPTILSASSKKKESTTTTLSKAELPVRVARRFDSLYLDPDSLDLDAIEKAASQKDSMQLSTAELVGTELQAIASQENQSPKLVVRRNPEDATSLGNRDAKAALQQSIPAIDFKEIPLAYFFRLVTQLSGVPVSVASEELMMAGISLRKPVSLSAREIHLSEAFQQVLEPLKLEYVADNGGIIVIRKNAAKQREISYPIDDILHGSVDEEKILAWIFELIQPKSWEQKEGLGTIKFDSGILRVNQSQSVHYDLLVFLERWRLLRDLPLKSRFPVQRLLETSPWLAIRSRMTVAANFNFTEYTPIESIVSHWERELGMPISVDWPSLAGLQIWPQSEISCAITNEEWQRALDQVLEPLGLGWRAIPGKSIEITTLDKIERKLQLDMFLLPQDQSGVFEDIKQIANSSVDAGSALIHDAENNILFALQPASVQRQIANRLVEFP